VRILMLAPEPFFEPRGTPFSEYHRIKALGELGHHVDLVTYPIGRDVELPNLRIFRSLRPPFVRKVRIGPSITKVVLDAFMLMTIVRRVWSERYDAIHSHEEMGLVGVWLSKWLRIPHLYDMHSSLPQQLTNFKYSRSSVLRRLFAWAEDQMVRKSDVVITICQELQDTVTGMGITDRSLLIENVMGGDVDEPPSRSPIEGPSRVGHSAACAARALYRHVRGLSRASTWLIEAAAIVAKARPDARVLVVGGEPPQVDAARARAQAAGAAPVMVFTGQQPAKEIPGFVQAADYWCRRAFAAPTRRSRFIPTLRSGKPSRGDESADAHASADAANCAAGRSNAGAVRRGDAGNDRSSRERDKLSLAAQALASEKILTRFVSAATALAYEVVSEVSPKLRWMTGAKADAGEGPRDRCDRFHRWTSRAVSGRSR
jgi:glycosyltransferase involved in cell wall biosynthesis